MSDKPTATERLRQLLDERGVKYETYHDAALTEVDAVFWQDRNGQPCSAIGNADDIPEGMLSVQCIISPEQAIEATLGRGTCKDIGSAVFECSECGCKLDLDDVECEPTMWVDGVATVPLFCPNCGRRVEQ